MSSDDDSAFDDITVSEEDIQDIITVSRVGYVKMLSKKKRFKAVYCILIGGSFYWFKNELNATEPLGGIDLQDVEIEETVTKDKKACFQLSEGDTPIFTGHVASTPNLRDWIDNLISNKLECEPCPCPERDVMKKKKKNVVTGAVKNVTSKAATSPMGKKVVKAIINDETKSLISALKRIVKRQTGDEKRAEDLENNIIKIAIKSFRLIDKGKMEPEEFLKADAPLREAFELLGRCYTAKHRVQPEVFMDALVRVENHLREAEEIITNILTPHLRPKNMFRISAAFGVLSDAEFLNDVFKNEEVEEDLEKLIDAMEYYTQFHYN